MRHPSKKIPGSPFMYVFHSPIGSRGSLLPLLASLPPSSPGLVVFGIGRVPRSAQLLNLQRLAPDRCRRGTRPSPARGRRWRASGPHRMMSLPGLVEGIWAKGSPQRLKYPPTFPVLVLWTVALNTRSAIQLKKLWKGNSCHCLGKHWVRVFQEKKSATLPLLQ